MMTSLSLQMISLGSLLIFNHHTGSSRCISPDQVARTVGRFQRKYWDKLRFPKNLQDTRTCAQAATEMHGELSNRSLSPWRYSLTQDDNRFPDKIPFAECLCQGCIIDQHEDTNYNSVPVIAQLMVLKKSPCERDPNKYRVKMHFIPVPVACICAIPNYAK